MNLCYADSTLQFWNPEMDHLRPKEDRQKIQKHINETGFCHPKSITHKLYIEMDQGGRLIIGAKDWH